MGSGPDDEVALEYGARFAREWAGTARRDDVAWVRAERPVLPHPVDTRLVLTAKRDLGELDERARRKLRAGFWAGFDEVGGGASPRLPAAPSPSQGSAAALRD